MYFGWLQLHQGQPNTVDMSNVKPGNTECHQHEVLYCMYTEKTNNERMAQRMILNEKHLLDPTYIGMFTLDV